MSCECVCSALESGYGTRNTHPQPAERMRQSPAEPSAPAAACTILFTNAAYAPGSLRPKSFPSINHRQLPYVPFISIPLTVFMPTVFMQYFPIGHVSRGGAVKGERGSAPGRRRRSSNRRGAAAGGPRLPVRPADPKRASAQSPAAPPPARPAPALTAAAPQSAHPPALHAAGAAQPPPLLAPDHRNNIKARSYALC